MAAKKIKSKKKNGQDDPNYIRKYMLAIELFKLGLTQKEIGKRIRMKTATVNQMLKGLKKTKDNK